MALVYDMPAQDYHDHPNIGSSSLRRILRTPLDFITPQEWDSKALEFGSAVHSAYLTPDLFRQEYAMQTEYFGPRNVGEGKKRSDEFKAANAGKKIIWWDDAKAISAIVKKLELTYPIDFKTSKTEVSSFCKIQGVPLKGRVDLDDGQTLWDLKTTTDDLDDDTLVRSIKRYGYHIQAVHYLELWAMDDAFRPNFGFIFVQKTAPYHMRRIILSEAFLDLGQESFDFALKLYKDCEKSGKWPGYPTETSILEPT